MRVDEDESAPREVPHLIGQIDEGGVVEGWIGLLHTNQLIHLLPVMYRL